MIVHEAEQTFSRRSLKPKSPIAREGLSFERKVYQALKDALPSKGFLVERNPWFRYQGADKIDHFCSPDILITDLEDAYTMIVEVKLSWVPNVLDKLRDLYCPVVGRALAIPVKPLVVAKNSAPSAPNANSRLMFALMAQSPFLLWRGDSPIVL